MDHWTRNLVPNGFEWTSCQTRTGVRVEITDNRWTATLSVLLASGEREKTKFFVEDSYDASLQKCILYIWRALSISDKTSFDVQEALADLRRFVP